VTTGAFTSGVVTVGVVRVGVVVVGNVSAPALATIASARPANIAKIAARSLPMAIRSPPTSRARRRNLLAEGLAP
jgi:hypothetical protein